MRIGSRKRLDSFAAAAPPPVLAGSLDFVVTLEENGCCEFFSLKALEEPFALTALRSRAAGMRRTGV
ncbi:hypothetical protein MHYP_G00193900 [Metynnis hypsauchen]